PVHPQGLRRQRAQPRLCNETAWYPPPFVSRQFNAHVTGRFQGTLRGSRRNARRKRKWPPQGGHFAVGTGNQSRSPPQRRIVRVTRAPCSQREIVTVRQLCRPKSRSPRMTTCAPAGVDKLNGMAVRNAAVAAATSTSFFILIPLWTVSTTQ